MGELTISFAVAFAFGIAVCATAADTRDYSTYVKLKADTTLGYDVGGGWPGADKWDPEGEMSDDYCYLIPSGTMLTSSTSSGNDPSGNPYPYSSAWPGEELAIQGTFSVAAKGNRNRAAADMPNVAIDPVGGPLMGKCIATMPYRGRWISLASMAGPETTLDVNLLWRKNLRVIGSTLRSRTSEEKAQILAGIVREVYPAFEARKFAPFVHKVMPLVEAAEAHSILERGENRGKVVLTV